MWFTAMGNQPLCSLLQAALSAFQPIASFFFRGPQRRGELLQLTRELGRARDRDHGRHADAKTTGRFSHGEWSRSRRGSPRRLLLGERRPVLKKPGCRCDTSRALLQRDDARSAAFAQCRRALRQHSTQQAGVPSSRAATRARSVLIAARRDAARRPTSRRRPGRRVDQG